MISLAEYEKMGAEWPPVAANNRGPTDTDEGGIGMTERICVIEGCGKPGSTRGWCRKHYNRWWKYGDPLITKKPNLGSGRSVTEGGYIYLLRWGHPLAASDGYVAEHRLVLWEAGIDPRGLHVHHKNEDKHDNRLENLEALTPSEHAREHGQRPRQVVSNQYGEWPRSTPENRREKERRQYLSRRRKPSPSRPARWPRIDCPVCNWPVVVYPNAGLIAPHRGPNPTWCRASRKRPSEVSDEGAS